MADPILIAARSNKLALLIDPDAPYFCSVINRETGEVREQIVRTKPLTERQQSTIRNRMERIDINEQTPRILLKGYIQR